MIEAVSCFELNVKLKQMTPIIHFQAKDYNGATLRASELRPKLDAFLIKYAFGSDAKQYEKYLVGYSKKGPKPEHKALDYRVTTKAEADPEINEISELGHLNDSGNWIPWGAQIVIGKDDHDRGRFSSAPVDVNIRSMHTELIEIVAEWLPAFFAVNNFGKRQNKGFGSFWLDSSNMDEIKAALEKWINADRRAFKSIKHLYLLKIECKKNDKKGPLNKIRDIYQYMKGGARALDKRKNNAWHSFLLKEYGDFHIEYGLLGGDKLGLKLHFLRHIKPGKRFSTRDKRYDSTIGRYDQYMVQDFDGWDIDLFRYNRAMLGLADHYDMPILRKSDQAAGDDKTTVNIQNVESPGDMKPGEIERFKSPVIFKPFKISQDREHAQWLIAVIPENFNKKMYGKPFAFNLFDRQTNGVASISDNPRPIVLYTPKDESEFDLNDFLDAFFTKSMYIDKLSIKQIEVK